MPSTAAKAIEVAVGVLRRPGGDILIAKRAASAHQGGLWEFPGGKREDGEDILTALVREFDEELGVEIDPHACRSMMKIRHDYGDKAVCLDVWWIEGCKGEPEGREGQPLRWVAPAALASYAFPEANRAIVDGILQAAVSDSGTAS